MKEYHDTLQSTSIRISLSESLRDESPIYLDALSNYCTEARRDTRNNISVVRSMTDNDLANLELLHSKILVPSVARLIGDIYYYGNEYVAKDLNRAKKCYEEANKYSELDSDLDKISEIKKIFPDAIERPKQNFTKKHRSKPVAASSVPVGKENIEKPRNILKSIKKSMPFKAAKSRFADKVTKLSGGSDRSR